MHRAVQLWHQDRWIGLRAGPVVVVVYLSWFWLRPCSRWFLMASALGWTFRTGPVQLSFMRSQT